MHNPINISEQRLQDLAQLFGCQMGKLPFTYLGLPMGTTRPKMADFFASGGLHGEKAHNQFHFSHSGWKASTVKLCDLINANLLSLHTADPTWYHQTTREDPETMLVEETWTRVWALLGCLGFNL